MGCCARRDETEEYGEQSGRARIKKKPVKLLADRLWGESSYPPVLWLFGALVLFGFLGSRELWTQEGRWAAIVSEMLLRHDYLHPYLIGEPYYHKPLLSYWLIVLLSYVTGGLNEWALRLPSAVAGLAAVWSTYRISLLLISRRAALAVAWMLLTTVFFVFWARVSSADMLNVAGVMLALLWYFEHRDRRDFLSYAGFFVIVALTCLTKGLVGAAVTVIALVPELWTQNRWRLHLNPRLPVALLPALLVYFVPFLASSYFDTGGYAESGLSRVAVENFTRYFQPFDHKGPIYTYVLYLPLYLMPWTFFLGPALWFALRDWKQLSFGQKWPICTTLLLFLFFTASGSRRSYYILPVVPFAALVTANWVAEAPLDALRNRLAAALTMFCAASLVLWMCVLQPIFVNRGTAAAFGARVREIAGKVRDWPDMPVVLSGGEAKMAFYLGLGRPPERVPIRDIAEAITARPCRVIITDQKRRARILAQVSGYQVVEQPLRLDKRFFGGGDPERAVAIIPLQEKCGEEAGEDQNKTPDHPAKGPG